MRSGGLIVAHEDVSDIPHSSQIGSPSALKYSSTSTGVGAAPTTSHAHWSSPSFSRIAALCSSGSAAGSVTPWASSAAFIFSQMRGTAPHTVGPHLRQVLHDGARVGDAGEREARAPSSDW